jgi:HAD superfamily hydrolase (TIGR01509 family)
MFTEKEEIMFRLLKENTRPTKGIIELLHELKRRNIRLAVASSSDRRLIDYILERLNVKTLFDSIMGAEDVACSKPNPEIFLKSAERLGVKPSECLVVEDAALGVEAAKRAGMKCVGYRNPNSGNQDLSRADIAIDDFSKLSIEQILS